MYVNSIQKIPDIFDSEGAACRQNPSAAGNCSFGDIFNRLLEGGISDNASGNTGRKDLESAGPKYNFAEADKINKGDNAKIDVKVQKKVETAINWLARYLGIKPSLLLAVFDELNIDPNDMADQAKLEEIISKLAQYFNLDEDKKKEMARELGGIFGFRL